MIGIGLTLIAVITVSVIAIVILAKKTTIVAEDTVAISLDRNGFIKRLLPPGRQILQPFEHVGFIVETRTKLASGRVLAVSTTDGILAEIDWSGTYAVCPELIKDQRSQRLRNLPKAEAAIARNVDILLRKLMGSCSLQDLFQPVVRERLERQASYLLTDRLKSLGLGFIRLNLQAIEFPGEIAEAINKARALETLDGAIRHLDPATLDVVRGVYQLDQVLHWDNYLPVPSRMTMNRLKHVTRR